MAVVGRDKVVGRKLVRRWDMVKYLKTVEPNRAQVGFDRLSVAVVGGVAVGVAGGVEAGVAVEVAVAL